MFSGIGGFELGIQKIFPNAECVGYSEVDKYAIQIYKKHFGGHKNYGDATKINPDTIPDFDLLVGGFPCQAFSIAGKRRGFEDTRGTMFFEIARILKRKQPRMFLLENVKGLLNHDKGNTFTKILQTIDELGYDAEWQVLNSKHFGVPQNRERVFIIGHLRGTCSRQVFPIRKNDKLFDEETGGNCIKTSNYVKVRKMAIKQLNNPKHSNNRVYSKNGISPALNTAQGGNRQPKIAGTLTGGGHSGGLHSDMTVVQSNFRIRRLTPLECERLQGFPNNWTKGLSDTQRYKTLGNAVTVNVIEHIIYCMRLYI